VGDRSKEDLKKRQSVRKKVEPGKRSWEKNVGATCVGTRRREIYLSTFTEVNQENPVFLRVSARREKGGKKGDRA